MSEVMPLPGDEASFKRLDAVDNPEDAALEETAEIEPEDIEALPKAGSDDSSDDEAYGEQLRLARKSSRETVTPDSVQAYLKQIGKVALLNASEEVDLAKRIEAGLYAAYKLKQAGESDEKITGQMEHDLEWVKSDGEYAKNRLIEANLRLVVSLAKRYRRPGMPFLDIIQEGNAGLIHAVEKFDYDKGVKFSTYATWWIRQSIHRAMGDQSRTVRIPVSVLEVINKLGRIRRELSQNLSREPTPDELGTVMGLPPKRIIELQQFARESVSLDQTVSDDDDRQLGEFIENAQTSVVEDTVFSRSLQDQLQSVLQTLSELETAVIKLRFGLIDGRSRTYEEIGQIHGVSRERIRRIESKTMSKLRHPSRASILLDYLES